MLSMSGIATFVRLRSVVIVALLAVSCGGFSENTTTPKIVDFSDTTEESVEKLARDSVRPLKVAIAGVISPRETIIYYEEMIRYISGKMRRSIQIEQRRTYQEINDRIAARQIDFAFVCSGAFVESRPTKTMDILVVPVVQGKPFYRAYVIANQNSGVNRFEDLKGKTFAFTDPLSNTGHFYAINRIRNLGQTAETFFSKTLFTYAHDYSIQMVSKNIVDGATVDGLIYEYLKKFSPEHVGNIIIIEKSEPYGIPPVVVPRDTKAETREAIQTIFLDMNKNDEGKKILDKLMIDRFELGDEENYSSIRVAK
jgi:phosphonate transport system substrate-binding protein